MKLIFREHFLDNTDEGQVLFDYCMAIRGELFKASPSRTVYRFVHRHIPYFIKIHTGVGWGEIFKNLFQLKRPVLGARDEWRALLRLRELGLNTLEPVGMGERGKNPASQESFLITHELKETVSLEQVTESWRHAPPPFGMKQLLLRVLAGAVRAMHQGGVNHRDCYLCHFRLALPEGGQVFHSENVALYIIDLHRAQIRAKVPLRWRVKDVAGLYFSSKDIGLTRRDLYRFIKAYSKQPLRVALQDPLWKKTHAVGEALYQKHQGKQP